MSGGGAGTAAQNGGPVAAPFDNTAPTTAQTDAAVQQLLEWAQALPDAVMQGYLGEL